MLDHWVDATPQNPATPSCLPTGRPKFARRVPGKFRPAGPLGKQGLGLQWVWGVAPPSDLALVPFFRSQLKPPTPAQELGNHGHDQIDLHRQTERPRTFVRGLGRRSKSAC